MTADLTDQIIRFEDGNLDEAETLDLFQNLVNTGLAWQLQGSYGRMARQLIEAGKVTEPKLDPNELPKTQVANFRHQGDIFRREAGGKTWIVGFATAYNALGLIGHEHNGIFVLDETEKAVVLDQHMRIDTGYFGPQQSHLDELKRLKDLSDEEFLDFIASNPRSREQYRK